MHCTIQKASLPAGCIRYTGFAIGQELNGRLGLVRKAQACFPVTPKVHSYAIARVQLNGLFHVFQISVVFANPKKVLKSYTQAFRDIVVFEKREGQAHWRICGNLVE